MNHRPSNTCLLVVPSIRRRSALAAVVTVASLVLGVGCSSTSSATPRTSVVDGAALQTRLEHLVELGVPGVVVLVGDGDMSVTLSAGISNLDKGTPMDAGATFRIASMTKPYTATLVLQLVDEGRLTLDDTVERWLPGIVANSDRITIRELLHHSSGVADFLDDPAVLAPYLGGDFEHVWTPRQLIEVGDELGSTSEPGTAWSYSNTNYAIAGLVIEAVTGHSFGDEMRTRVFDKLELEHSTFAEDTTFDPQMAHGYLMSEEAPLDATGVYPVAWGAGNIISDAADAATFYHALFSGELLSPEMLAEMRPGSAVDEPRYGLGLTAVDVSCGVGYGHDGGWAGYSTRSLVMDNGRQVVILANSITFDDHLANDVAAEDRMGVDHRNSVVRVKRRTHRASISSCGPTPAGDAVAVDR